MSGGRTPSSAPRRGLLLVLALGLACRAENEVAERRSMLPEPNVVLIVIDTLRADRLPFHGGPDETAPFLASLAERGLVFDNAWAASSWTAPATATIFTGLYPNQHGVEYNAFSQLRKRQELGVLVDVRLPDQLETLPGFMRRMGYRTYGVSDNPNVGRRLGFERGFDRFAGRQQIGEGGAAAVVAQVGAWLEEIRRPGPYFLYLHFMDPHGPYRRHAPWIDPEAEVPEDPSLDLAAYDSEIRHTDEHIRRVLGELGADHRTLVIVTSDHGQEFLDHGGRGHGFQLYSELTWVPLLIYQQGNRSLTGRVEANVSHADLLPTLRDVLGAPPDPAQPGRSLLALDPQERPDERPSFSMRAGLVGKRVLRLRSVVKRGHKLILLEPGDRVELYDLEADPEERVDLAASRPELVSELREELRRQQTAMPRLAREGTAGAGPTPEWTQEEIEQLEALGYGEGGINEGLPSLDP